MTNKPNEAEENRRSGAQGADTATNQQDDFNKILCQIVAKVAADNGDAPATESDAELLALLEASRISPDEAVQPDEFLFEWCGVGFMPRENVISLKAPAKSGKTFALTLFALAYINGNYCGLKRRGEGGNVLLIDTEQARNDTRKLLKRIADKCGNTNGITVLNVRDIETLKRFQLIEYEVRRLNPSLIIIDGCADLIPGMNYNDQEAADAVITAFCRIAQKHNAVVLTAIHTNNKDDFATGWLGRMLRQKCALELSVKKIENSSKRKIEASAVRHMEINPITFDIIDTDDHIGEAVISTKEEADRELAEAKRAKRREELLTMGFTPGEWSREQFNDKVQALKTKYDGKECPRNTARGFAKRCIDDEAVRVIDNRIIFDA